MSAEYVYTLVATILKRAEMDYNIALKKGNLKTIRELRQFYLSDWGQMLSRNNGQNIINRIEKEFEEKNQHIATSY